MNSQAPARLQGGAALSGHWRSRAMPGSQPSTEWDVMIGRRVSLPGYFEGEVTVEAVRPLGTGLEIRVRLASGELDEAVLSKDDAAKLVSASPVMPQGTPAADAGRLRLLIESARIRLAYAYD